LAADICMSLSFTINKLIISKLLLCVITIESEDRKYDKEKNNGTKNIEGCFVSGLIIYPAYECRKYNHTNFTGYFKAYQVHSCRKTCIKIYSTLFKDRHQKDRKFYSMQQFHE